MYGITHTLLGGWREDHVDAVSWEIKGIGYLSEWANPHLGKII